MRNLLVAAALLVVGCDGEVMMDDVACPEPLPETVCDAGMPTPIDVVGAHAVYTWAYDGGPLAPWTFSAFTSPSWEAAASGGVVDVPDLLAGDSIFVLVQMLSETADGGAGLRLAVAEGEQKPIEVHGAKVELTPTSPRWVTVTLSGVWTVSTPGKARVIIEGRADPGGRVYVQGSVKITAIHSRI